MSSAIAKRNIPGEKYTIVSLFHPSVPPQPYTRMRNKVPNMLTTLQKLCVQAIVLFFPICLCGLGNRGGNPERFKNTINREIFRWGKRIFVVLTTLSGTERTCQRDHRATVENLWALRQKRSSSEGRGSSFINTMFLDEGSIVHGIQAEWYKFQSALYWLGIYLQRKLIIKSVSTWSNVSSGPLQGPIWHF